MPDAPAPGWWLASDGNWYPPEEPIPSEETDLTGGLGGEVPPISPTTVGSLVPGPSPWIRVCLGAIVLLVAVGIALALTTGGSTENFSSGTPSGKGFLCSVGSQRIFVTWSTVGGQLIGIVKPSRTSTTRIEGSQTGAKLVFSQKASKGTSYSALISGDKMTLTLEGNLTVQCKLESIGAGIEALPMKAKKATTAIGSVGTQSNLVNSLLTAKTIYKTAGTYPGTVTALASTLERRQPAIQVTGGAPTAGKNIISAVIGGTAKTPNPNVIILTATDSHNGCWIVADNEGTRPTVSDPSSAIPVGSSYAWEKSVNGNCAAFVVKVSIPSAAWSTTGFAALHHTKT